MSTSSKSCGWSCSTNLQFVWNGKAAVDGVPKRSGEALLRSPDRLSRSHWIACSRIGAHCLNDAIMWRLRKKCQAKLLINTFQETSHVDSLSFVLLRLGRHYCWTCCLMWDVWLHKLRRTFDALTSLRDVVATSRHPSLVLSQFTNMKQLTHHCRCHLEKPHADGVQ